MKNQKTILKLLLKHNQVKGDRMVKSSVIVIDLVSVKNLLVPLCCVLGNDTL